METGKYRIITTDDGTPSLYSEAYNEAMHSTSGAYEEALLKHILPSRVLDCTDDPVHVLDIGCGIGYNMIALVDRFFQSRPSSRLHITSFEKDVTYLPLMSRIKFNDSRDAIMEMVIRAMENGEFTSPRCSIKICITDARSGIQKLPNDRFNAVFHDPYSPAKNPELWTVNFFREVRRVAKDSAIMTTYSSAAHIRQAMLEAGLKIGRGPSVGKKKEGTIATVVGNITLLENHEIDAILADEKSVPFRDQGLCGSREEILERRAVERKAKRDHQVRR